MKAFAVYAQPACLKMLALGFSAGLPLLLVLGTLSFWLREAGIDRTTIGHLSWVGLAYGFKWAWAPLVDRVSLPILGRMGRRRSWLLLAQVVVIAGLLGMAASDPRTSLNVIVGCALLVAFASATQDIALDAFRIESGDAVVQAALAASYQTGYRLAMIWSGAGALWLAARTQEAWALAYGVMALSMLLGVVTVLLSHEPTAQAQTPRAPGVRQWLQTALIQPVLDFFVRYGWQAVFLLALISTYRISDVVMGIMANPFYVDMGYSKDEVATVTKIYGVLMTLLGAFLGGALAPKLGVRYLMVAGAILSAATNFLFVWLAARGHDVHGLIVVVSADNLASGLASAAFIAYLSSLTNINYTATQYALMSSLMLLLPKFLAGFSGEYVDAFGYESFFTGTALMGIPVVVLVWWAARLQPLAASHSASDPALR